MSSKNIVNEINFNYPCVCYSLAFSKGLKKHPQVSLNCLFLFNQLCQPQRYCNYNDTKQKLANSSFRVDCKLDPLIIFLHIISPLALSGKSFPAFDWLLAQHCTNSFCIQKPKCTWFKCTHTLLLCGSN